MGPRQAGSTAFGLVAGLLLVAVGLHGGVRYGGWAWAAVPVGLVSVAVQLAVLYLDPFGEPRRGIHGVLRERREARRRAASSRPHLAVPDHER